MRKHPRTVFAGLLLTLTSCGDDGQNLFGPTGDAVRLVGGRGWVYQTDFLVNEPIDVSRPGTVQVTVNFTEAASDVRVYLADVSRAACSAPQFTSCLSEGPCTCDFVQAPEPSTPTRTVVSTVTSRTPVSSFTQVGNIPTDPGVRGLFARLRLFVWNGGPRTEWVTYEAVLLQ